MPVKRSAILLLMLTSLSVGLLVLSSYRENKGTAPLPGKCDPLKCKLQDNKYTPANIISNSLFQLRA